MTPPAPVILSPFTKTSDRAELCQRFLISFFGTHLVLVLYAFQLQASIATHPRKSMVENEALWTTYSSALTMLQLVSHPSLSPLLSFAHDSVHTMTAYAASFLIKVGHPPRMRSISRGSGFFPLQSQKRNHLTNPARLIPKGSPLRRQTYSRTS